MSHTRFRQTAFALLSLLFLSVVTGFGQTKVPLVTPENSVEFGSSVYALPNGNIVVTDYSFNDPGGAQAVGAVYLFNGKTGELISRMTGSSENDEIGGDDIIVLPNSNFIVRSYSFDDAGTSNVGSVTLCSGTTGCPPTITFLNSLVGGSADDEIGSDVRALPNGNYVVLAQYWDNGGVSDVGAVVFCSGVTGCTGNITQANALIGTNTTDQVGRELFVLADSDFVIVSRNWDSKSAANVGAVTYCSGTSGCPLGAVSSANSLVGSAASDQIGNGGIAALPNGNYVVSSYLWNGAATDSGAATFCNGTTGCVGPVSDANSLVGSALSDQVSNYGVKVLANGHYVVGSGFWDSPDDLDAGALTWCSGSTGCTGAVSTTNSLYGTSFGDNVGDAMPLANGNYVAKSLNWNSATASNAGAATFCLGDGSCTGPVTTSNSMYGSSASNVIGNNVLALSNGNYVLLSLNWDNGTANNVGAVTYCSGVTGCVGAVSGANSLIGSNPSDGVGQAAFELANGNVVIVSQSVDIGGVDSVGAVTLCTTSSGCPLGPVSSANSLVGSTASDRVGSRGIVPLANGSFVVLSSLWDNGGITNAGAATLCNGVVGCTGAVSPVNSLVGTSASDVVGDNGVTLGSNFAVISYNWDNGAVQDAGAVTICSPVGCSGSVSPLNSIIGSGAGNQLGNGRVETLPNGDLIVLTTTFDAPGSITGAGTDIGAVTYFDVSRGETGPISLERTVLGGTDFGGSSLRYDYDPVNTQVIVASPVDNKVTLLRPFGCLNYGVNADLDCDGKTDLSVFRPSNGVWYFSRTSDGFGAVQWGVATDIPIARDYDGDGRADIAVFRPSATPGVPDFYILNSLTGAVSYAEWGQPGDIPVGIDFEGDGIADIGVFRPSNGSWYMYLSSNSAVEIRQFGQDGDIPVEMDYNGDGKDDLAVFRPSDGNWYIARPTGLPNQNFDAIPFGANGDIPVAADYDGDGKDDIAVFRPSNGYWYILNSGSGTVSYIQWGISADVPVPGDYDGDGKADQAVFRDGVWWLLQSTDGVAARFFGIGGDSPVPRKP